jgi:hypothetical protein
MLSRYSISFLSRVEFWRSTAVDAQHPDTVALVAGPLVLMALRSSAPEQSQVRLTRALLLSAKRTSDKSREWTTRSDAGELTLKPFMDIQDEGYTTYLKVFPS